MTICERALRNVQGWMDATVPARSDASGTLKATPENLRDSTTEISIDLVERVVGICGRIKRNDRGRIFKQLFYEGDWSGYPSRSEAELGLLNILAWATYNLIEDLDAKARLIKLIFTDSAFYKRNHRPQWDRRGYLDEQIEEAISSCTSGYTGKPKEQMLRRFETLRVNCTWGRNLSVCAAYGAHIALAYDHGRYAKAGEFAYGPHGEVYAVPNTGVLVHSSIRDLSLFSGIRPTITETEDGKEVRDYRNLTKLNDKLEEMGLIKRVHRGAAWGIASLYLLPETTLDPLVFSDNTHKPDPHPLPYTVIGNISTTTVSSSGLCVSGEKCVSEENILLAEKLNWIPKDLLAPKQRFVVEQVAWGRDTFDGLLAYFGGEPKHLRYRVLGPLLKANVLTVTDETYTVDMDALDHLFASSGGEDLLDHEKKAVKGDRLDNGRKIERYETDLDACPPDRAGMRETEKAAEVAEQVRFLRRIGVEVFGGPLPGELDDDRDKVVPGTVR